MMIHALRDRWLGIHLSGPKGERTAIAFCEMRSQKPVLTQILERIGPRGALTSDERLVDIIESSGSHSAIFVDVPLGLPPCMRCERPVCPSMLKCEDLSVAYMLSLSTDPNFKRKTFSPQSHRVWDVYSRDMNPYFEPSFSGNLAPLVLRGKVLQKRLAFSGKGHFFMETNIPMSLMALIPTLGIAADKLKLYRNFEQGSSVRQQILRAMIEKGLIEASPLLQKKFVHSLDGFHAGMCAWLNIQYSLGRLESPPVHYLKDENWVWLPTNASRFDPKKDRQLT